MVHPRNFVGLPGPVDEDIGLCLDSVLICPPGKFTDDAQLLPTSGRLCLQWGLQAASTTERPRE